MVINWKDVISADGGNNFYNGGWVKKVTGVDASKPNGYCFEGDFVNNSTRGLAECSDGLYLVCSIQGSRKNQRKEVAAYRITGEQVERVSDWVQGNDWALKIRAKVAELLDSKPNPLAGYSTEELLAELRSRGVEC